MNSQLSDAEMEVLSRSECYRILASRSIGRIAVVIDTYPVIIPVNYGLDGETVVIRTAPGTTVAAADQSNVTFEVDEFDAGRKTGWSVLLRGKAEAVTFSDPADVIERTVAAGASPWAPGERGLWIRVTPEAVSGRRIVPGSDFNWQLGTAAYM